METYSDIFIWVRMPFLLKICLFDSWIIKGNLSMELYWHAVLNLELLVLYMTVWLITRLEHNPKQILAPFFQKEHIFKNTISKFIYHVYIWFIYHVNVMPFIFSYDRVEVLSGFINGLFLVVIGIFVFTEALGRLVEPPVVSTERLLVSLIVSKNDLML